MTRDSLTDQDWAEVVERLGGAEALAWTARASKAFLRPRVVRSASDLLRLVLAYCLGDGGLRLTAVWAAAIGLADLSNMALLQRLRQCGDWLAVLVGQVLAGATPAAGQGRLIRLLDATSVPQAGAAARRGNKVWRIHSAFDVPAERFGSFVLTDHTEGERLDRIEVIPGEIRIADRAYMHPGHIATVCDAGADVVVRSGWKSARWCDAGGQPMDLIGVLRATPGELIDRPIWLPRQKKPPLGLRLVAVRKSEQAAEAARRKARRDAQREGHQVSQATLLAAGWILLLTSLDTAAFAAADVLALYRLRWRIELGFKRLKSVIGLHGPPGIDERSATPYVLAHLLVILLLEPLIDALEDSPRSATAA
jgi:hypothetical protein